ncbi:MAG: efflux RND transporter periplasmic adaptor subunit [Fuerstiella sp.]
MRGHSGRHQAGGGRRRLLVSGLLCMLVVLPVVFAEFRRASDSNAARNDLKTEPVQRGRFVRTVPAEGEIRTFRPAIVYSDCRAHEREIIELIPEGTWVEKGDVVCRLDASELQDTLRLQQTQLIRAKAGLADARAQVALQEADNARRLAAGSLQTRLADARLTAFEQAESITDVDRLKGEIQLKRDHLNMIALGATAEMEITVDDREDIVQVPLRAVFHYQGTHAVIVCETHGPAVRMVQPGIANREFVEVRSGLEPGDHVVIDERSALKQLATSGTINDSADHYHPALQH